MVLLLPFWGGDSCSALQIALLGFHCLLLLSHSIKASGDLKVLPKERLDHTSWGEARQGQHVAHRQGLSG